MVSADYIKKGGRDHESKLIYKLFFNKSKSNSKIIPPRFQKKKEIKSSEPTSAPQITPKTTDIEKSKITTLDSLTSEQLKVIESIIEDFTQKDVEILDIEEFNDFSQEFIHKTNYNSKNKSIFGPVYIQSSTKDQFKTKLNFQLEIIPMVMLSKEKTK